MAGFNAGLGLAVDADGSTIVLDAGEAHQAAPGVVHFAVLATLGEVAAAHAVTGAAVVPTSVNVSLLARARPGRLEGRGRVLRQGRRLAFAEGEVFQDGDLVAKVAVTFALIPPAA